MEKIYRDHGVEGREGERLVGWIWRKRLNYCGNNLVF